MTILSTDGWGDYELLDSGQEYRLERFGAYRIARPDPQAIWKRTLSINEWNAVDARFERSSGEGKWNVLRPMPQDWSLKYKEITLTARLTPFKHTGIFPEQSVMWDFIATKLRGFDGQAKVLNLFAYTGAASLVAAAAGAHVTHVDASKPSMNWAKENQVASGLQEKPIRWILDDVVKFVEREVRRGNTYDGIILDPPVFGHGPTGKPWKFHDQVPSLLENITKLLVPNPLFVVMNAYAISSSALMLSNLFEDYFGKLDGNIDVGELVLQQKNSTRLLSTGIFAKWEK